MVLALKTKITQEVQQEVADGVEAEKKGHSIVITGLAELGASKSLMERKRDLEEKVANVLDALEVDCRPEVAYRLGKFNVTYRTPDSAKTDDDTLFDSIFELCLSSLRIIIVGDFNVDMKKHSNCTIERFKTLLESCDLAQNIHAPTRLRSILLVLSSGSSIGDIEILPPFANSDHNVVSFMFDFNTEQPLYLSLPDFSRVNYSELRKFLARVDWLEVFDNYQSVAEMYRRFCPVMYDSLAKCFPDPSYSGTLPSY
ncbi:hypothetical protein RB195_011006 [Necator americanus]|uniref:Endonuclease/exonuclease/phosphatase domain-containing protein n=1 Tax=Necator americanus TaxID=51031 RepID=A0ABR1D1N7_NECAM